MQITYTIYEQRITPEEAEGGEAGPPEIVDSGCGSVKEVLREASTRYGIRPRATGDGTLWFCSEDSPADLDFFKYGIEKQYTLHIHSLTARSFSRINRMLKLLCGEK